jgi:acyl transferase domain-containing protein
LEKAPPLPKPSKDEFQAATPRKRLYVLSANDKVSLEKRMHALTIWLEQNPEVFQNSLMANLAYTLGQRRSVLSWKVAVPTGNSKYLISTLAGSTVVPSRSSKEPKIGFVFTGQGAQWHAMGRELLEAYPIFATTMKRIDECLTHLGAEFSLTGEFYS